MPDINPKYQPGESIPARATGAAVTGGRFVTVAGAKRDGEPVPIRHAAARSRVIGVTHADAVRDDVVAVLTHGHVLPVEAGGTITAGDDVSSDANGRAVRFDTSGVVAGVAFTSAASAEFVLVQLR